MEDADKLYGFSNLKQGLYETSTGSTLSFYYTHPQHINSTDKLVMVLLHGWPET